MEEMPKKAAPPKNSPNWRSDRFENADEGCSGVLGVWEIGSFGGSDIVPRWRNAIGCRIEKSLLFCHGCHLRSHESIKNNVYAGGLCDADVVDAIEVKLS